MRLNSFSSKTGKFKIEKSIQTLCRQALENISQTIIQSANTITALSYSRTYNIRVYITEAH